MLQVWNQIQTLFYRPVHRHQFVDGDSLDYSIGLLARDFKPNPDFKGSEALRRSVDALRNIDCDGLLRFLRKPLNEQPQPEEDIQKMIAASFSKTAKIYDEESQAYQIASALNTVASYPGVDYVANTICPSILHGNIATRVYGNFIGKIEELLRSAIPVVNIARLHGEIHGQKDLVLYAAGAKGLLDFLDYRRDSPIYLLKEK